MRYPDFYIVGAPKCGTTSLAKYLNGTSSVCVAHTPEPLYFCGEIPETIRQDTNEYLSNFRGASVSSLLGDKSTFYLYSTVACRQIREARPDAKIVIMLRPPVDLIFSLHAQSCWNRYGETELDLRKALALEPQRARGESLPIDFRSPLWSVLYRRAASYVDDVERWLSAFGAQQTKILLLNDLHEDPKSVYEDVCHFLNVRPRHDITLAAQNERKHYRFPGLRQLLEQNHSTLAAKLLKAALPVSLRRAAVQGLIRWNQTPGDPPRTSGDELKAELRSEFASEVERLETLIDRDLSRWK